MKSLVENAVGSSSTSSNDELKIKIEAQSKLQIQNSCDVIPEQSLSKLFQFENQISFYLEEGAPFTPDLNSALSSFSKLIFSLSHFVFSLPIKSVNLFYDKSSNRIAFNRAKSLFFNLRYYICLLFVFSFIIISIIIIIY